MSNIVYQQFPLTSSAVDQSLPVSTQIDTSASNTSLGFGSSNEQLPVSGQHLSGHGFSGVPGLQSVPSNEQHGQFGIDPSYESHQFLPNQQCREGEALPNRAEVMQSSVSSKRKKPMEPLSVNRAQDLMPNKRYAQIGQKTLVQEAATPNSRSAQVQPKFNSPKAQGLPAQNKRGVQSDPRSWKSGSHQLSAGRNQSKVLPSPRVHSDSNESVRSKMRESLAGALSLVSGTSDRSTVQGSQSGVITSSVQSEDAQPDTPASVTRGAAGSVSEKSGNLISGEDAHFHDGQGQPEISSNVNIGNTLNCGGTEYDLGKMSDENISFTENFFVKDEFLQGNGLSWVLDPYPETTVKDLHSIENQSFVQENEGSQRNESSQSPESLAFKIEAELHKLYGGVNKKYKEKGRSLLFNLKDRNNPELRERVMSGEIPPDRLCSMTAEELASKELSQWRIAKAEELAQMVVLPDTEVNVRRLVKKTHKGEYQVEMDQDGGDSADIPLKTSSVTSSQAKPKQAASSASQSEEFKDGADVKGDGCKLKKQVDLCTLTISPNEEESDLLQGLMVDDVMKGTGNLPSIVSLDEFMQSLDSEPPFENLSADGTTPISDREYSDRSDSKGVDASPGGSGLSKRLRVDVAPEKPNFDDASEYMSNFNRNHSGTHAVSKDRTPHVPMGEHVWKGLIQLNIAASSSIIGIFKCGEKASTKEWPSVVEVKGRVRVDAFEKFLQELPMSRSRAVMAVHLVCTEEATESEHSNLQEAVDSYILDERVGFAEPVPGIELYLCPSHKRILEMLDNVLSKVHIQELNIIDNGLIGIVVWRKFSLSPESSNSKHGSKKEPLSRRQQERDTKMGVNLTPTSKTSTSMEQLHSIPVLSNDDDDVDLPPGFGPPASRDDDLPEFDFSSGSGKQPMQSISLPSLGLGMASPRAHQLPPADRMRELVHRYGQTRSDVPSGAWQGKGGNGGAIKPWDDDEDDIPEWKPQVPYQQSMLRPHTAPYQRPPTSLVTPPMPPGQPLQPPLMNRGLPNVHQTLTPDSWGVHPSVSHGVRQGARQFYGAPQQGIGQQGTRWRNDAPNRGF